MITIPADPRSRPSAPQGPQPSKAYILMAQAIQGQLADKYGQLPHSTNIEDRREPGSYPPDEADRAAEAAAERLRKAQIREFDEKGLVIPRNDRGMIERDEK